MSIQQALIEVTGIAPLLLNNPRTVDRFDPLAQKDVAN